MIRLIPGRTAVGEGHHRSGWPYVLGHLKPLLHPNGILLDDFVEQTYLYAGSIPDLRECPWIGVFHHPCEIRSPLKSDMEEHIRNLKDSPAWRKAAPYLRGAIAMSEQLAEYLRTNLNNIPVLSAKHPSEVPELQWTPTACFAQMPRRILQTGHYLRNTRAAFQIPPVEGYVRVRILCPFPWVRDRERQLRVAVSDKDIAPDTVVDYPMVDNVHYDQLLASSVVLTEIYGASANNVVIECIARGTPLLVNRVASVEEYLGKDYPLYFENLEQAAELLDDERLVAAHEHIINLDRGWLRPEAFCDVLQKFVSSLPGLQFVCETTGRQLPSQLSRPSRPTRLATLDL